MATNDWSDEEIERYARSAAAFLELEIPEGDWPAVLANVRVLRDVARALLAEPLADETASAPVFSA